MSIRILEKVDTTKIKNEVLLENGKTALLPAEHWKQYDQCTLINFCHEKARYGIHTLEQNKFLNELINNRSAIEIGAGCGDLGYHLPIKMTDSFQQDNQIIKKQYEAMMQPTIVYGKDIEKIDALDAVKKYKPQVVVASWVTTYAPKQMKYGSNPFGIKEEEILDLVETYILIGNIIVHGDKPIMHFKHDMYYFDWLISRSHNQENNRIWVWSK